jgi:hypothetical protein
MILKLKRAELSVLGVGVGVGVGRCPNRVLRVTFGPEMEDGTGDCRELHNEKFGDVASVLTSYWGNEMRGDQVDRACDDITGRAEIHTEFW